MPHRFRILMIIMSGVLISCSVMLGQMRQAQETAKHCETGLMKSVGMFMQQAREVFRTFGTEVIYGTIRAIMRDTVSFLPWAKDDFACVIFNLRTLHTDSGIRQTAVSHGNRMFSG